MHDVRAVTNFLLDRAADRGVSLTVMTLLKILYFAHAWFLAKHKKPLIAQPFEAWQYGPVSRLIYDQFKVFGKKPITAKAVSFNPTTVQFAPTPYSFDQSTSDFLGNIFDYYSQFHPYKLSDLTHEEGSPWHKVWTAAEKRAVPGMVIPNESIAAWFEAHGGLYSTDRERRIVQ